MVDHVKPEKRSQIMAAVKGKDTKPEFLIRRLLHAAGYRYRLHRKDLPGRPDMVLRKYNAIVFIHSCFWHGHGCKRSKNLPKTNTEFWKEKIEKNNRRDTNNIQLLKSMGWRVCVIWECALKRQGRIDDEELVSRISAWLKGRDDYLEIEGL